ATGKGRALGSLPAFAANGLGPAFQKRLDAIPHLAVNNRFVAPRKPLVLVPDLPDINRIAEHVVEVAPGVGAGEAARPAGAGLIAELVDLALEAVQALHIEIDLEDPVHDLCALGIDDQLLVLARIAYGRNTAHPHALLLR